MEIKFVDKTGRKPVTKTRQQSRFITALSFTFGTLLLAAMLSFVILTFFPIIFLP